MLNIVVTRSDGRAPPLLCNYLTTPQMVRYTLWPRCTMSSPTNSERVVQVVYSASLASCSIPGVYDAVELMAKDRHGALVPYFKTGGHRWLDGGAGSQLTWKVAPLHATCREQVRQKGPRKAPRRRLFTPRAVSRWTDGGLQADLPKHSYPAFPTNYGQPAVGAQKALATATSP